MGCGASSGSKKGVKAIYPEAECTDAVVPTADVSSTLPAATSSKLASPISASSGQESGTAAAAPASEAAADSSGVAENAKEDLAAAALIPQRPKPKITLVKAVKENKIELIDDLLRDGAELEALGMWDNTPLLVACTYGYTEIALKLIAKKANVWAKNEHDATPLHYAAVEGTLTVVEALLSAVRSEGSADVAKYVNCSEAKVYNRHLDAYARRLPLGASAESGFPDVVSMLLAAGTHVEAAGEDGKTALWLASRHSRVAVLRLLLQHGASTNSKDSTGMSVLQAATISSNEEVVLSLLTHGVADVNDTIGSPLRDAVKAGKRAVVEALLTHGAAVQTKPLMADAAPTATTSNAGATEKTPLHMACEKGDEYLVALLVRARADTSLSDPAGLTAVDLLRRRGFGDKQIVALLSPPATTIGEDGGTGGMNDDPDTAKLVPQVQQPSS